MGDGTKGRTVIYQANAPAAPAPAYRAAAERVNAQAPAPAAPPGASAPGKPKRTAKVGTVGTVVYAGNSTLGTGAAAGGPERFTGGDAAPARITADHAQAITGGGAHQEMSEYARRVGGYSQTLKLRASEGQRSGESAVFGVKIVSRDARIGDPTEGVEVNVDGTVYPAEMTGGSANLALTLSIGKPHRITITATKPGKRWNDVCVEVVSGRTVVPLYMMRKGEQRVVPVEVSE
jgi:hypothetical protein